jgi:hypothetical protein
VICAALSGCSASDSISRRNFGVTGAVNFTTATMPELSPQIVTRA